VSKAGIEGLIHKSACSIHEVFMLRNKSWERRLVLYLLHPFVCIMFIGM
jgi:hypothetical protein